ncbi:MAG: ABC transporter permease, partial [Candidatus Eremiobacteraeota bacterium]|nr:ABC transporter permease [Candidatus Eremiobacteraeota bacterium]
TVLSVPNPRRPGLNELLLTSGAWFSPASQREAILNEAFAEAHHLRPGDTFRMVILGQEQTFTVAGRAQSPEFVYVLPPSGTLAPDPERSGVIFLPERSLRQAADLDGAFNELIGQVHDTSPAAVRKTLKELEELLEPYGVASTTPYWEQASVQFLKGDIDGLRVSATIMPGICLGVVALVLNIVMGRLVAQQRVVVGTLKALGYSGGTIIVHYAGYGLAVGIGGSAAGVFFGHWMQSGLLGIYRSVYQLPIRAPGFYPDVLAAAVAIGLTCALAGTAFGVRAAARLEPAEAMRPPPPEKGGAIFLEHLSFLWGPLPFRWKMMLRSIFRNPYRTAVTAGAAMVSTALVVESLCLGAAVDHLIEHEFEKVARQDVTVVIREPVGRQAVRELQLLPGVETVEPQLAVACELSHGSLSRLTAVTGVTSGPWLATPRDANGQPIKVPPRGIVLTSKLAQILQLEPGDTVKLRTLIGERKTIEAPVVSVITTYLGLAAYADIDYLSHLLGEAWVTNSVLMTVDPAAHDALVAELEKRPMVTGADWREVSLNKMKALMEQNMGTMLSITILFAGLMAFGSVLNTALVSLSEREREVGTLRVLGYTPFQVSTIFALESFLVNGFGVVCGWQAGAWLVRYVTGAYDTEIFRFPVVFEPMAFVVATAVMAFFVSLAQFFVYRILKSIPWLDVLKIRE